MRYSCTSEALSKTTPHCVCLAANSENGLGNLPAGILSNDAQQEELNTLLSELSFSGKTGESLFLPRSGTRDFHLLIAGIGDPKNVDHHASLKIAPSIAGTIKANNIKSASIALNSFESLAPDNLVKQLIDAIESTHYRFDSYKSEKAGAPSLQELTFHCQDNEAAQLEDAIRLAQAVNAGRHFARTLGNEPGNVCTPAFLAEQAQQLEKDYTGLSTQVLDEEELEKMGMGAFVSVSKGSTLPGKLITMEYYGKDKTSAPYVLVGKGITFDTGGISLKPGAQMDEMKFDMCGSASVLGVMKAIVELKPKLNVIGVIAAAENMPAGNASKPGDIVTTLSGQTVEILNTDAEGRLVLCDTLTYVEKYKPAAVIDIATLTGACIVALGHCTSAVMGNDQSLVDQLLNAGQQARDKAWQLPLWDDYQSQLDSPFADMQNIGGKGAGSITAGCFLSRFTKSYPWAHLDVAGTAWVSGGKDKGATGRPVPLLMQYLVNQLDT